MNKHDSPQPDESPKIACVQTAIVLTIAPDRLYLWLKDRRDKLRRERQSHLTAADRLNQEIAAYEQLLAELTT